MVNVLLDKPIGGGVAHCGSTARGLKIALPRVAGPWPAPGSRCSAQSKRAAAQASTTRDQITNEQRSSQRRNTAHECLRKCFRGHVDRAKHLVNLNDCFNFFFILLVECE